MYRGQNARAYCASNPAHVDHIRDRFKKIEIEARHGAEQADHAFLCDVRVSYIKRHLWEIDLLSILDMLDPRLQRQIMDDLLPRIIIGAVPDIVEKAHEEMTEPIVSAEENRTAFEHAPKNERRTDPYVGHDKSAHREGIHAIKTDEGGRDPLDTPQ